MKNMTGEPLETDTMVGKGHAFVAGLPARFNLHDALCDALVVRLATAFAHKSGWKHVRKAICQTKAKVFLLTGLDRFFQTEPAVLRDWRDLGLMESNRIAAKLASDKAFFHPKVLVVRSTKSGPGFVVVGSGNLSQGGLRDNVECSLYTENRKIIRVVSDWFDCQFRAGVPITKRAIDAYEVRYERNRVVVERARRESVEATKDAVSAAKGEILRWEKAVRTAKGYFRDPKSKVAYRARREAIGRIRELLHYPTFDFDSKEWRNFFEIGELGQLNRLNRDRLYRSRSRLRKALRLLIKEGEKALPYVLQRNGPNYLPGLGINTVSKVLAAHDPKSWPVFNSRVASALGQFDYKAPRGAGLAGRYVAYKQAMERFMIDARAKDTLALDAFFYDLSKGHW